MFKIIFVVKFHSMNMASIYLLDNCVKHHHDDVRAWKCFLHYWAFVRGICQSPVDSPHKGPVTCSLDSFFVVACIKAAEYIVQLPVIWDAMPLQKAEQVIYKMPGILFF